MFSNLLSGFTEVLRFQPLLMCFVGVACGTMVGALPGIGAMTAVSLLLPLTYYLEPTSALIMLAGIFYGSQYGNSISAILLNIPGTSTAVVTTLDGYPMTKQGRAGVALFITTISSFTAGSIGILLMMTFAPVLANVALSFRAPDYFSAMLFAIIAASTMSQGAALKGLAAVLLGIALGTVGIDTNSGMMRFSFGSFELANGISLVALAMGLFGVAEILSSVGMNQKDHAPVRNITLKSLLPNRADWRAFAWPTVRGTAIGSFLGILPGAGPTIAAFLGYSVEKRISANPEKFGKGAIEGIAAPEAANNAAVQAGFIPTLSLGIPGDAVMAVLLAAMVIHGIIPGPQFISNHPEIFWGLVASFWIGNVFLLILNIPLIGIWVRLLSIPYHIMYPAMLFFIAVGVYSVRGSTFDIYVVIVFGAVGYILKRHGYSTALVLLGFILGPLIEQYFRRSLLIAGGDMTVFVREPISLAFIASTIVLLGFALWPVFRGAIWMRFRNS